MTSLEIRRRAYLLPIVAAAALIVHATSPSPPSFDEVRARHRRSDAMLLDRSGQPLHELRVDARRRVLDWTPLSGISAALQEAVVAAEDRRFYSHHGIDFHALAAATVQNIKRLVKVLNQRQATIAESPA